MAWNICEDQRIQLAQGRSLNKQGMSHKAAQVGRGFKNRQRNNSQPRYHKSQYHGMADGIRKWIEKAKLMELSLTKIHPMTKAKALHNVTQSQGYYLKSQN